MSTKKVRRRAQEPPADSKPTKMDYAVAKYMRQTVAVKKTKFMHHVVEYFSGARAVDALMESPWAPGGKSTQLFASREEVVTYLDRMLRLKFFHRARKIAITEQDLRRKQLKKLKLKEKEEEEKKKKQERGQEENEEEDSGSDQQEEQEEGRERDSRVAGDVSAGDVSAGADSESRSPKPKSKTKDKDKTSKTSSPALNKRRVRLDMHLEQRFVDNTDAFVWIYSPISAGYWLLGAGVLAAAVAICLFPLWPSQLRQGVYYLSLAGGAFLLVILALTVLRTVLFAVVWLLSFGRHHIWILPNLTEDVGFFASFWPLYKYNYYGPAKSSDKSKSKTKKRSTTTKRKSQERADVSAPQLADSNTDNICAAIGGTVVDHKLAADAEGSAEWPECDGVRQRRSQAGGEEQRSGDDGALVDSQAVDSASSDTCSQNSSSGFEIVDKE